MGQVLHRGLLQGREPQGGHIMWAEAGVHIKLVKVGSCRWRFAEEVLS